jgi:hypothetical protein
MKVSLQDWLASGWLAAHTPSQEEVTNLFAVVDRDLEQCQLSGLDADWKHNIAYNAALQLANLALRVCGYRARREAQHYRVLQSLTDTVGSDERVIQRLDRARKRRNFSEYDAAGAISLQEAEEVIGVAAGLRATVSRWLQRQHPEFRAP